MEEQPHPARFVLFTLLVWALAGCTLFPQTVITRGHASPEAAAQEGIRGSDGAPYLFRTLFLSPDRAFVAFRSSQNTPDEVDIGYTLTERGPGGWNTRMISGMGFGGGERQALANLILPEENAQQGVLFAVLVDDQIASAEGVLPDGTRVPLFPQNAILLSSFDLNFPFCGLTFLDGDSQPVLDLDLAAQEDQFSFGEISPEMAAAVEAACMK